MLHLAIAEWKIAKPPSVDQRGNCLPNQDEKTRQGNREDVMRACRFCRTGSTGAVRPAYVHRFRIPIKRMETVRLPVGKSCASTDAMPVSVREPFDVPREKMTVNEQYVFHR
ncbi:hypothetical protein [Burkholderia arboris]|uniref:hypothetical protein n=1 Tax=Burkholderia arboris TaxID=488730 RepID=UPI001CF35E66|nr:hypothetical protein [Burkholderia arboris]MCA8045423.1 hypothetical protein [Burkholderia arboris]